MGEAEPKRYFPAFVDLECRHVVIVGSGKSAEKRARQFVRYGADVTVICPEPSAALLEGEAGGDLIVEQRPYVRGDLADAFLAICTEEDSEVRRAVFEEAESEGCLLSVSESPQYSNFLMTSVVRQGRLELAISTGGAAPEAAKALRLHLDTSLGDEWRAWIELIAEARVLAATRLADDPEATAALLAAATDPELQKRLSAGERITAEQLYAHAAPRTTDAQEEE